MQTIKFSYPRRGLMGSFNTFRLGSALAKLNPGEVVELVDSRSGKRLKLATVTGVCVGPLNVMAPLHAHSAHNWKEHPEAERPALLTDSLRRRYPPNRVREDSIVAVIYLEVIE